MKVTINPNQQTPFEIDSWPTTNEPSRVDVEEGNRSYSIVLEKGCPKLEIWEVTPEGELGELKAVLNIPNV